MAQLLSLINIGDGTKARLTVATVGAASFADGGQQLQRNREYAMVSRSQRRWSCFYAVLRHGESRHPHRAYLQCDTKMLPANFADFDFAQSLFLLMKVACS